LGKVDAAVFGSGRLTDDDTLVIGLGDNRTLTNLKENPTGVFMFFEPGATLSAWKGARLYVELVSIETGGVLFEEIINDVALKAGKMAAAGIRAAVTFKINEVRPVIDFGGKSPHPK
jgi:hypothetical protein